MRTLRAWASDRFVRVHLQRSLGARALVFIAVAGVAFTRHDSRLEWFGIFLALGGAILCTVDLLEMQQDGRLDQVRLSGRPPGPFLAAFAASMAGPWLIAGVGIIASAHLTGMASQTPGESAVIVGFFLLIIVGGLRLGLQQSSVDARLVIAGLIAGGVLLMVVGEAARAFLLRLRATTAPFVVAIEVVLLIWIARPLVGLIAYPPAAGGRPSWGARMPQRRWMLRAPGLFRGVTVAFNGTVLLAVFVPMVILLRLAMPSPRPDAETAFMFVGPLIVGLVTLSILCREDAISGRLELIRQSAVHPVRTGLEMAIGLWSPFVFVSVVLAALTWALFFVTIPGTLITIAALVLIAPLPIVEGWSRYWPLTYMAAFLFAAPFLRVSWPTLVLLSALHWYAVPRKFADPYATVLSGWPAVAAAAAVGAMLGLTAARSGGAGPGGMAIFLTLLAVSPLLIANKETTGPRLSAPFAVALAVGIAAVTQSGAATALALAIAAGVTWIAATRFVIVLPERPAAQAVARLVVLALLMVAVVTLDLVARVHLQNPWLLVAGAGAVCAAAEIASRTAARVARRDARPATPPA